MKWLASVLLCLSLIAAEKWTVDDILLQEQVGAIEISRDGRFAVYTKSRIDKDKGESVSHIWLRRFDDPEPIQLTRGQDSASSPKISPSGKLIAFLTSRRSAPQGSGSSTGSSSSEPSGQQIWLMNTSGGEPWQLTRMERGVRTFDWISDDALAVAAVVLGLVCAGCLAALLVLTWAGADPWDGFTVVPWFAFPVAFLLLCASLVRSVLRRRRV